MMRGPAAARVLAIFLLLSGVARGQDAKVDPDRPDVTNGTHIVDVGMLQMEIGGVYTRPLAGQHGVGTPFTARIGIVDWLEARIGADGLTLQYDDTELVKGVGNVQIGAKLRLWAEPGGAPVMSILPTVNLPAASAEKGLGSGSADYTVAVLTGADIGARTHVDVNYGIGAIGSGVDQPHFLQHLASVSASAAATDNWNPYVEVFWFSRDDPDGGAIVAFDVGAIYELGSRYALDGGVQIGLNHDSPGFAAFGGVSIVVGNVLGSHGVHARQRRAQDRARARPSTRK